MNPRLTAEERPLIEVFHRRSVEEVAIPFLRRAPDQLDRLLDTFIRIRSRIGYHNVLAAAVHLELPLAGRFLTAYSTLFGEWSLLSRIARHATGGVEVALMKAAAKPVALFDAADCALEAARLLRVQAQPDWRPFRDLAAFWLSQCWTEQHRELLLLHLEMLGAVVGDEEFRQWIEYLPEEEEREQARLKLYEEFWEEARNKPILELIPETAMEGFDQARRPVRKVQQQVGRNAPCPCGSGKKFKHCCLGKPRESPVHEQMSPIPGLSESEFWSDPERHIQDVTQLDRLRIEEQWQLNLSALPPSLLWTTFDDVLMRKDLEGTFEILRRYTPDIPDASPLLRVLLLFHCRFQPLNPEEWLPWFREIPMGSPDALENELPWFDPAAPAAERLRTLDDAAAAFLQNEADDHELCPPALLVWATLMMPNRALGLLLYRGLAWSQPQPLFEEMTPLREVRHRQLTGATVDPFTPRWRSFHDLPEPKPRHHENSSSLRNFDEELQHKETELLQLRKQLEATEAHRQNLEARLESPETKQDPRHDQEVVELRKRLHAMRADLSARHAERNALRRELNQTQSELAVAKTEGNRSPESTTAEPSDEGWETGDIHHKVRIPVFTPLFLRCRNSLPEKIVSRAVAAMGWMGAGEDHAFVDVKRLQLDRRLYRKRLGSYRLLFTLEDEEIVAQALIPRADLDHTAAQLSKTLK